MNMGWGSKILSYLSRQLQKKKKKKSFADKPLNTEIGNTICKTEEMRDLLRQNQDFQVDSW